MRLFGLASSTIRHDNAAPAFGRDRKLLLSILVIGIVAIVTSWGAVRKAEHALLQKDALDSAIKWDKFVRDNLSDLDGLLSGDPIIEIDQRVFEFASKAGDVFRYRVFGPDGRIVVASRPSDLGKTNIKPYFSDLVKKGRTFVKIEDEEDFGDDRSVVSEAYVPIIEQDRFRGAIEVYVDMTSRAVALREIGNFALAGLFLLMGAIGGVCGVFVRHNLRARNQELREVVESRRKALAATVALRESEELFRTFVDYSPAKIHIKDTKGRYILVNLHAEKLFGVTNEEARGKTTQEIFPPEIAAGFAGHDRAVLESGQVIEQEEEWPGETGVRIYLTVKFPILDADGRINGVGAIGTDITERKRTEEALRDSKNHIANLAANVPGVVYQRVLHEDGTTTYPYISSGVREIYGYEPEDIAADPSIWRLAILPEDLENYQATLTASVETIGQWRWEGRIRSRTGTVKWVQVSARPRLLPRNVVIWDGLILDVTERKRAEEAAREQYAVRSWLHRVSIATNEAESIEEAIQACLNDVCARIGWPVGHAYVPADNTVSTLESSGLWHLEDPDRFEVFRDVTKNTQFRPGIGLPGRVFASGKPAWIEDVSEDPDFPRAKLAPDIGVRGAFAVPVFERKNTVVVLEFFSTEPKPRDDDLLDLIVQVGTLLGRAVERKRFEDRLRQSAKLNAIGQLAGGVAHDFNNLLMIIDGYTRRAMAKRNDQKVIEDSLAAVLSATQKAGSLTKQLLSFSRRQVMHKHVFRVSDVLRDVEVLLRRIIGEQYDLKFMLADEGLCVETDPDEFSQAIINLAINARDAMPAGGRIFVGTRISDVDREFLASHPNFVADRIFEVYVRDEGHGMDADTLLHVFEPFFTTKQQGKGTGLGLAMVYGFAQQSGGEIDISSTPGEGTTVHIYLPIVDRVPVPALSNLAVTLHGKGEKVLLVEDDDALRLLIQETLEEIGYSVLVASDGAEAIETDQEYDGTIDLLLTDIVMPGINGLEVADCVKQARPGVKILVMSGYPTRGDSENPEIPAELPFLQKPVSSDQLAQKVREVLDRKSLDYGDAGRMELRSDG